MRWRLRGYLWGMLGLCVCAALGCSHTISQPVRQQAVPPIPFTQLRANSDAYLGRTVILGGEILSTQNMQQQTFVEVLQKPLDSSETPLLTDQTGGRFMARCDGYLDPAVYTNGRLITIAGRVIGTHKGKVGEVSYVYPLITCLEMHLFPYPTRTAGYRYYPAPWYRYPWPWYWYGGSFFYPYHYPFYW